MNYTKFKQLVNCGMEHNFYLADEEYWISHNADGYYLTRVKDNYTQEFITAEELFRNGKIDDKSILELWDDIEKYL